MHGHEHPLHRIRSDGGEAAVAEEAEPRRRVCRKGGSDARPLAYQVRFHGGRGQQAFRQRQAQRAVAAPARTGVAMGLCASSSAGKKKTQSTITPCCDGPTATKACLLGYL